MAKPLTKEERETLTIGDEIILAAKGKYGDYVEEVAQVHRRYERTIQDVEAQRDGLVEGILDIDEWMSGRSSHICPFCKGVFGEHKEDCLREIAEAIKEVTDGA